MPVLSHVLDYLFETFFYRNQFPCDFEFNKAALRYEPPATAKINSSHLRVLPFRPRTPRRSL